jgi:phosphatidylserine synthase
VLDPWARGVLARPLDRVAAALDRPWCTPDRLTLLGLALGLAAAGSAAGAWWPVAAVLWLGSRAADGLDGPLARRRAAASHRALGPAAAPAPGAGGYLDIGADFVSYGAFVVGVAYGWGGSLLPFLFVLLGYYLNGSFFLAFSSIAERTGHRLDDGRSLSFLGGIAEGTETVLVHTLWCLLPGSAGLIAWVWAAVVLVGAAQRLVGGYRVLASPAHPHVRPPIHGAGRTEPVRGPHDTQEPHR